MDELSIVTTADGSHTVRNELSGQTYHSIHGAVQESKHVFIQAGLNELIKSGAKSIELLEVGFGTGLNTWLTLKQAEEHSLMIRYTAIEPAPVPSTIWANLNFAVGEEKKSFSALHESAWDEWVEINSNFTLRKMRTRLEECQLENAAYALVYYDAFAPAHQPELWDTLAFERVAKAMKDRSVLVTYCAKGQVKRNLRSTGFRVETLAGPPGKREMIRATLF